MKTIRIDNWCKLWRLNDKRHREDGPACEYAHGTKEWWLNGELHREDGPAIENTDGTKEWWLSGVRYTKKEFHENNKSVILQYNYYYLKDNK